MSVDTAAPPEQIRLVIWDLDDTFWSGTLTEGGVRIIERNVAIVKTLSARGIVNAICSKNDAAKAQAELEQAGIWEYFVLSRIAWEGKGAMVRGIVQAAQLRPETVLFIDDNPINLNEVRHYNPAIQLARPDLLDTLLDDPRFAGRDDAGLTRLAHYKALERKTLDQHGHAGSNLEFLRQSEIQISFHPDVMAEFDRVHELINRTNQLNFTKLRLSEDRGEAHSQLAARLAPGARVDAAYIKVSDKYGDHGIAGFYMTMLAPGNLGRALEHFLFSCRTMNMGIEQFVYGKLARPHLEVAGEVAAELHTAAPVDWITVVADAAQRLPPAPSQARLVCLRGSCDLDQMLHYLGYRYNIVKEFPHPFKGAMVPMPAAQLVSIFDDLAEPEHQALFGRVPFLHRNILNSRIADAKADVYVISFAMEELWSYFRYKPTGLVLPMRLALDARTPGAMLTGLSHQDLARLTHLEVAAEDWDWFVENFEYAGEFDPARFERNIADLFHRLAGKEIILVLSNTRHGPAARAQGINAQINAILERMAQAHAPRMIHVDDLITGTHDVLDANHFGREVYARIAEAVRAMIDEGIS